MLAIDSHFYLQDCLKKRLILFTGKGGVGKSAVAWATAVAIARQNRRVCFVSWSPFDAEAKPYAAVETEAGGKIQFHHLETMETFREYALKALKFDKVYDLVFENKVLRAFIEAAPGLSETVIAGKIWDLYEKDEQDTIIVDLPSTGHAFSFFQSPIGVEKIFRVGFVHREAHKISQMLCTPTTRIDLVTIPEEMPMLESLQFKEKLLGLAPLPLGFLLVNQCLPQFELSPERVGALSPELQACVLSYCARKEREAHSLKQEESIGLPTLHLPRFPTEAMKDTILSLSHFLEKHE